MLNDILNIIIALLILASGYITYRKYQLTKARSLAWLTFGCIYLTAYRAVIVFLTLEQTWRNILVLPFYIIFTIAMYKIWQLLKLYIHQERKGAWFTRLLKKGGIK